MVADTERRTPGSFLHETFQNRILSRTGWTGKHNQQAFTAHLLPTPLLSNHRRDRLGGLQPFPAGR